MAVADGKPTPQVSAGQPPPNGRSVTRRLGVVGTGWTRPVSGPACHLPASRAGPVRHHGKAFAGPSAWPFAHS